MLLHIILQFPVLFPVVIICWPVWKHIVKGACTIDFYVHRENMYVYVCYVEVLYLKYYLPLGQIT